MDPITDLPNYAAAIRRIESSGNYGSLGPQTKSGDRAYGAYQVMGANIPSWTKKHYGTELTPQQFLQDKKAQDAVFNGEFGGYVQKHGNPQDAASMWFSGKPMAQAGNVSDGYNTVPQYVQKVNKALGGGQGALSAIEDAAPTGGPAMPPGALGFAANGQQPPAPPAEAASGPNQLFAGEQPNKLYGIGSTLANIGSSIAGISNPAQANSLHNTAQSIEAQGKGKFQYQMGANGQLLRINKDTNAVDSIAIPDAQKSSFKPLMGKDDNGNPTLIGSYNENTGEYKPVGGKAAAEAATVGGDPNLTGEERRATLTPAEQRQIDAWHEGTGIQPSQYSMRNNPKMQKLMDAASAVYGPSMDFQKYGERQQFVRGYANKQPSQFGGQLVSIEHTAELAGQQADRYLKLANSSGGPAGYGATTANMMKSLNPFRTAEEGNARAKVLQEAKGAAETLSGEYQTMITRGKGGGQAERAEYAGNVYKPNASPEVQSAGLQAIVDGLKARHKEIVDAALTAGGQSWLDRHPDVDKNIQATIDKVQKKIDALSSLNAPKGDTAPAPAVPAAAGIPGSWADAQKAGWK